MLLLLLRCLLGFRLSWLPLQLRPAMWRRCGASTLPASSTPALSLQRHQRWQCLAASSDAAAWLCWLLACLRLLQQLLPRLLWCLLLTWLYLLLLLLLLRWLLCM